MKKVTLKKYCDPGHGWYAVPVSLIEKLELDLSVYEKVITNKKGKAIFLEEDSEINPIVEQLRAKGIEVGVKDFHCNKQSKIRNYPVITPIHFLNHNNAIKALKHFIKE